MTRSVTRRFLTITAISALALALLAGTAPAAAAASPARSYIVVLNDGTDAAQVARQHASRFDLDLGFVYRHALRGYSAVVPAAALGSLRADSRVAFVERDASMRAFTTQTGATWGIDRTDQRTL